MRSWGEAWEEALLGPAGFYRTQVPLAHFRTNAAVPLFAEAVLALARQVDAALGFPDPFDLVDLGSGRGELLAALGAVPARWRLTGVDVAPAPPGDVTWLPALPEVHGLLVANEWLDTVPLDVVEDGRLVLVDDSGQEALGAPLASAWAADWWPDARRVEIGASRDLAWATAVSRVRRGLAVAVDYGHTRAERRPTLTGYRDGRQVPPVPDGSCDITAHVALDAVAAATGSLLVRQRDALQALGLSAAVPGPAEPAFGERLARASQARELLDPDGLGAFGWLLRPVDVAIGWMGV